MDRGFGESEPRMNGSTNIERMRPEWLGHVIRMNHKERLINVLKVSLKVEGKWEGTH